MKASNAAVWLFALCEVVTLSAATARADTTLVVNFGPFPSAEVAGHAESQVDWLDANDAKATACTECFAALELRKYLRKITGRTDDFAITPTTTADVPPGDLLLIGGPESNAVAQALTNDLDVNAKDVTALGSEGYRIKTAIVNGRRVTLVAGGGRAGTLYATYDLLHRMGCRWLGPNDFDEEVSHGDWQPDFDVTERPSFTSRGFYINEKRGDAKFWMWMARNRLNDWCVQVDQQPLLRKLGFRLACGSHDAQFLFLNPNAAYPYKHARFGGDTNKPADPYTISEEYQGDANSDGRLSYFEAHPEWFPMVGGRRVPGIGPAEGTNMCTSNADALTELTENYVQSLINGAYRGADVVNFWALDQGKWCECAKCKAQGIPTDRNLQMVYRLDQQVKQARREGRLHRPIEIRFLAYMDLAPPPTVPLPADFDYETCLATFYPISRCYVHLFDDPKCPRNAEYQQRLLGWAVDADRHYRGKLVIGEYYNVSRYKSLPLCLMHGMAHDIPFYYRAGARSFQYMHVTTGHWGNKSLTNYQMARQLWDVNTDCDALWQDFFAQRYGPAADVMRQFYESLEKMLSNVEPLKGWSSNLASRLEAGADDLFTESHLRYRREPGASCDAPTLTEMIEHGRECRRLIDQARAVAVPERVRARIAENERMFTYGERTLAYYSECAQAFTLAKAGKKEEAIGHFAEAKRVAELLRQDTWSVDLAFIHDEPFPNNAFQATYATKALDHLAKLLGPLPQGKR